MTVLKKLNDARQKFHALELKKTGHNKFAGYYYFELADFLIPALRVFNECGLCAVVSFDKDIASMTITDLEDSSSLVITSPMGSAALKGCHEVQNIGAVETYQRRYLWVAALEIVEHDALDATTGKAGAKDEKPRVPGATSESFRSSATMGALDDLPAEEREYLRELSVQIIALVASQQAEEAWRKVESENLDDAQKTGLWLLLDSKTRAAIKKAGQTMKEPA